MPASKIATCCYCGARAALVLSEAGRHELSCASCGAPLHEMKMLRAGHVEDATRVKPSKARGTAPRKMPATDPRRRRKKRGSAFALKALEEIWDAVEDIFD